MALANGCSLSDSTAAASVSSVVRSRNTVVVTGEGDVGDDMGALRERSGLVEEHGIDLAHALQRQPILDEDPCLGGDGC